MRASCLLLISVVAAIELSLLRPARCQPPGVIDRAPPPIAQVIKGAPPLPVLQPQDLEKELRPLSDRLTAELQKKYGFCMADAYVALFPAVSFLVPCHASICEWVSR